MTPAFTVTPLTPAHADHLLAIYQTGLDTGNASFETTAPDWPTWDANHLTDHRYVATDPNGTHTGLHEYKTLARVRGDCLVNGVSGGLH
jgi:L-amino acid N-acyltransferase YncA